MARRKTQPAVPAPDQTLFQFTSDFFQLFGAQAVAGGSLQAPTLDVDLRDRAAHAIVEAMTQEAGGKIYSQVDLTHALGD